MRELLELCGFDEQESQVQLPRIQETFARLGITEDDIETGKERLNTYYDMDLRGVRKVMGVLLKDLADIVLMRDEGARKVIHACMAPGFEIVGTVIRTNSKDVGFTYPNFTFLAILEGMFGKATPVFEAAEKLWLRGGVMRHCGMVKTRVGLISLGLLPRPDLTVTTGYSCDTSPKSNEVMEAVLGIPAYCVDTTQDRQMDEFPDGSRATTLAAKGMRRFGDVLRQETGFEITDDMVWRAIEARKPFGDAVGRVLDVIRHSDPLPLASTHLSVIGALGSIPFKESDIPTVVDALDTLHGELEERVRAGAGVTPKGAPRLMVCCPNNHSDPRFEHLANQMGLAIVASDFDFASERMERGAGVVDPNDPYDVICQHLHYAPAQFLGARIAITLDACRRLGIDGVINHYHVGCRFIAGDAIAERDAIIRELDIPVLMFEWESFDPRAFDHEQHRAKLEVFRSMLEAGSKH